MRQLGNFIAGMALALVCCSAIADDDGGWLPNKTLTPGAIAETHAAVLCLHGYARTHRVWRDKAGTLAKTGLPLIGLLFSRTTISSRSALAATTDRR
jgi:hypothetical protein